MKFSIGDPVYIKSNNEEGIIDEFIGKDMASVKVNGKTYYAYLHDLDHPYLRWFLNKPKITKPKTPFIDQLSVEKFPNRTSGLSNGIYLVFMPIYKLDGFDEIVDKVKVYFYNETFGNYNFEYSNTVQNEQLFTLESELLSEAQFYLHDISFEEIAKSPSFKYRFVDKLDKKLDNESVFILKPKKLFEKLDEIKYANHAIFHFMLFNKLKPRETVEVYVDKSHLKEIARNHKQKTHFNFEQSLKKSTHEIDLHIEKLVKDYKGMASSEIIQIQLTECRKAIDLAIATHQSSIIIIHGIGKGVLKNEINSLLNQTIGIKKYVNEYDVRYGYGATKVIFKY